MKSVKINNNMKEMLKEYPDERMNYDAVVNRLIHDVADYMPLVNGSGRSSNINLHEDTMEKLKSFQLTSGESYENIIIRMLLVSMDLYSGDDK